MGGNPDVVGQILETDIGDLTILGVMPAEFRFEPLDPAPADLWVLSEPDGDVDWIARLRAGVDEGDAASELRSIVDDMEDEYPGSAEREIEVLSLVDAAVGTDRRHALMLFLGAVTLVLGIAVANTANLMLARGIGREHEMAVRAVTGSTRMQLVRQLLVECLLLGILGGTAGVMLASQILGLIVSGLPPQLPRLADVAINGSVLAFALGAAIVSGLVFGMLPALSVSLPRFDQLLKENSRTATESRWRRRLRSGLVASEVALAMVLLTGGLLLARSFVELVGTPLGMDIENVIAVMPSGYDNSRRIASLEELAARLEARPDVEAATMANMRGMRVDMRMVIEVDGQRIEPRSMEDLVPTLAASPKIFGILGIPIASGRAFEEGEDAVVVSESFIEKFFPGRNPLEQVIGGLAAEPLRIVGVVPDFRLGGLDTASEPTIVAPGFTLQSSVLFRVRENPARVMRDLRAIVREMDPEAVVDQTTLVDSLYASDAVSDPQFRTAVLGTFAGLALAMGLAGISGVTAYTAGRRRHEVGIRIALGATRTVVVIQMLREAMRPVLAGITVGTLAALGLTRLISAYLYETSPTDPAMFALAVLILTLTALIAAWVPLTRATAIEPVAALRHQ
jgi:putative ABC transport system permease protein